MRLQRVKEVTNFQLARFPKRKKRYEKSEILKRGELAKTLTRVDVFDWSLSRRVFNVSSREGVEARLVESGRLEERIER